MRIAKNLLVIAGALFAVACDQLPGADASGGVAVVDLNAVAKATGRDEAINERMESARVDLNEQLTQIAGDLEQQLKDEQEKVGAAPEPAEQQQLQEMAVRAQRQLAEKQQLAQQKATQFQLELVNEFRLQLKPVAEKVAASRGADIVVVLDDAVLWFDSGIDITAEVIADLRANPLPAIQTSAGAAAGSDTDQTTEEAPE